VSSMGLTETVDTFRKQVGTCVVNEVPKTDYSCHYDDGDD